MSSRIRPQTRALQTSADWVVKEITHGLQHHKLVIPLLLEGVDPEQLKAENLPPTIQALAYRTFCHVRIATLERDCEDLAQRIRQCIPDTILPRKGIFISYRRRDVDRTFPLLLSTRIEAAIGAGSTFIDRQMRVGDAFPTELQSALDNASVMVVVIGLNWMDYFAATRPASATVPASTQTRKYVAAIAVALTLAMGASLGLLHLDRKHRGTLELIKEQERRSVLEIERAAARAKAEAEEIDRRKRHDEELHALRRKEAAEAEARAERIRRQDTERDERRARSAKAKQPDIGRASPHVAPLVIPPHAPTYSAPAYTPSPVPPAHPGNSRDVVESLGVILGIQRRTLPPVRVPPGFFHVQPAPLPQSYDITPPSSPLPTPGPRSLEEDFNAIKGLL